MKKAKIWLEEKGLKHIGLVIAAIIFWIFFPGIFNSVGLILVGIFIGLNWEPIKDLSNVDEKIEEKYNDLKEKYNELTEKNEELVKSVNNIKSKTGIH
jgi:chromate transport protein ChrA